MDIAQESISQFTTGQGSVGITGQPIVTTGFAHKAYKGVTVRASPGNTGVIFVGMQGVKTTTGFSLPAGEKVEIPVDDPSKVYLVADAAGQGYSWLAA
ncbi:MAG: hypothetical protein ABSG67_19115 [Thermoguttaceae bacterium]|jgi:hypothetical protein